MTELKAGADTPEGDALADAARRLFDLDDEDARTSGEVRRDSPDVKRLVPAGRGKAS